MKRSFWEPTKKRWKKIAKKMLASIPKLKALDSLRVDQI